MTALSLRSVIGRVIPRVLSAQEKRFDLEELLDLLPPDAREAAEIGAVRVGMSKNPHYAAKASDFYADKESGYDDRARFEILKGNPEGAIAIYEEGHFFMDQAAEIARDHVGIQRAIQVYEDAIKRKDVARYHEGLARLYETQGDDANAKKQWRRAIAGYEKERLFDRAADLERKHGTIDKVIEIYVRTAESMENSHNGAVYYQKGAEVAEEIGNHEKALQLYEKALDALLDDRFLFDAQHLIDLAKKVGDNDKLITVYEKASQPQEAYKLALQEGYTDRAMGICLEIGVSEELSTMAKFALDKGHAEMAIQIYEHAGLDKDAARTAYQYGNPQKALEICQPKIDTPHENGYFSDPDYYDLAMDAAFKIGDEAGRQIIGQKAMQRFSVLGRFDVSAQFAERLGDFERANTYKMLASLPKM